MRQQTGSFCVDSNIDEPFRLITPDSIPEVLTWMGRLKNVLLVLGAEINAEISHAASAQTQGA